MKKFLLIILFSLLLVPSISAYTHHESNIEWHDYSEKSFNLAKQQNKPVFMLVTAVWCHWCHVYVDQSLEQEEIYTYLNENYITIFVDADQRQDLTRQYLAGGWPTTVIFSPHKAKITEFSGHRPPANLIKNLEQIVAKVDAGKILPEKKQAPSYEKTFITQPQIEALLESSQAFLMINFDPEQGGYGKGQKFPHGKAWDYLLTLYELTSYEEFLNPVILTYNNIAPDNFIDYSLPPTKRVIHGLYDPVEGGFFRYATRRDWTIPHYEKMLRIQSDLIKSYLHLYKVTSNERYKDIALKSLDYVLKNLYDGTAFLGSQDAGHELYYRLTPSERADPNNPYESTPFIDKTKYTEWNAQTIITFYYASEVLSDPTYKDIATRALNFYKDEMLTSQGILHYYTDKGYLNGQSLDNAHMSLAFLIGYEETSNEEFLNSALKILDYSLENLYDSKTHGFYERKSTNKDLYLKDDLFVKTKPYEPNAVFSLALIKAYDITKKEIYLEKAIETLSYTIQNSGEADSFTYLLQSLNYIVGNNIDVSLYQDFRLSNQDLGNLDISSSPILLLLLISLLAGLLSLLSPCTLPILPAYIAYMFSAKKRKIKSMAISFFLGLALIFSLLGVSATFIGSFLSNNLQLLQKITGILVLIFGILILSGKGFSGFKIKTKRPTTIFSAFLFGMAFAISWAPCIGPILTAILILAATTQASLTGSLLLLFYSIGLGLPLVIISFFLDKFNPESKFWKFLEGYEIEFNINKKTLVIHRNSLIAGILIIILGVLMFTGYLYAFNRFALETNLQNFIFNIEEKLLSVLN